MQTCPTIWDAHGCVRGLAHDGHHRCDCGTTRPTTAAFFDCDEDGDGEPTIWLVKGTGDPLPMPVLTLTDLSPDVRHLWPVVVRAMLTADPGTAALTAGDPPRHDEVAS